MTNNKFKVGDKVICVEPYNLLMEGKIYTVSRCDGEYISVDGEGGWVGHYAWRFEPYIEPVCNCEPKSTEPACSATTAVEEESYLLEYRRTFPESGDEYVRHTIKGEPAGQLTEVLEAVRNFLVASGFQYIAELNAVTEDGSWHSSAE